MEYLKNFSQKLISRKRGMAMGERVFLYPVSRQFPFDEVCENIVRELEKRNWNVPDIWVKFDDYGSGEEKYRMVREIFGKHFCIYFCRIQGKLSSIFNDVAAVSTMIIPRRQLEVYEDESGPVYYVYVGDDWKKDENNFFNQTKCMSKYYKKPRTYLRYSGVGNRKQRSPILRHCNDLGREYDLLPGDKDFFETKKIFTGFKLWLKKNVLDYILSFPVAEEKIEECDEILPVPKDYEVLYTIVEARNTARIDKAKNNPDKLEKGERYGLLPSYRLVHLGSPHRKSIPSAAFAGSIWCTTEKIEKDVFFYYLSDILSLAEIRLKNINEVYVAELAGREEYRNDLFNLPDKERMTNDEYEEYSAIPGRTIVPLSKYQGNYIKPVILINREIDVDEIFVID